MWWMKLPPASGTSTDGEIEDFKGPYAEFLAEKETTGVVRSSVW